MAKRKNRQNKNRKTTASERDAPIQNDAESVQKGCQSTNEKHIVPPLRGSVEVSFPPRIEERNEANQKRQETRDKWKFRLEIATLAFVFITVVINWYIFNEMSKTTKANTLSADAAAASTAAWIVVEDFTYKGITEDMADFQIAFKNVGKTPALDAAAGFEFVFIPGVPWLTDVPRYQPFECPKTYVNMGIVSPEKPWGIKDLRSNPLTIGQIKMINARAGKIFIHGCAKYRDILTDRERITEVGGFFPGRLDPSHTAVSIYSPYNRLK
jgi:hypothetical protein